MNTPDTILGAEVHACAAMFPLLDGPEFDDLVASIAKDGIRHPIVVVRDPGRDNTPVVIDGRNRLRAWAVLVERGLVDADGWRSRIHEPADLRGDDADAIRDYIVSANIHRRHLTPDQRVQLLAKVMGPQLRSDAAAEKAKGNKKGADATNGKRSKEKVPSSVPADRDARTARGRLANAAGVNDKKAGDALVIAEAAAVDPAAAAAQRDIIDGTATIREVAPAIKKKKAAGKAKKPKAKSKKAAAATPTTTVEDEIRTAALKAWTRLLDKFAIDEHPLLRRVMAELIKEKP